MYLSESDEKRTELLGNLCELNKIVNSILMSPYLTYTRIGMRNEHALKRRIEKRAKNKAVHAKCVDNARNKQQQNQRQQIGSVMGK